MRYLLAIVLGAALFVVPLAVHAQGAVTVDTYKEEHVVAVVGGLALTSGRYTGWLPTHKTRSVVFDIEFTDANSSCTAVEMVCWTSRSGGATAGTGYRLQSTTVSAGMVISYDATWCKGSSAVCGGPTTSATGTASWNWTVSNIPGQWLQCYFTATGTPAAADLLTVYYRDVTP